MPTVLDRPRSAEDTLAAIKPWLERAGVSRLADVTGMDRIGIPVYASIRPDSLSLAVDSGKGVTRSQAKCSAAMEALERWAGDEIPLWKGRFAEAYSPPYTKEFRFSLNAGANTDWHRFYDCTKAIDLITGDEVFVPYYAVKLYEPHVPLIERCWVATTNGLSAGSTREDAITSGIYEVIERDGMTIAVGAAARHGIPLRKVDLDKVCDTECMELVTLIRSCGAKVFVYDCTSDFGIPIYACVISEPERGCGLHRGAGCHVNGNVAMVRAICEAAQTRCILMAGARDDITVDRYRRIISATQDINWAKQLSEEPFSEEVVRHAQTTALDALLHAGLHPLVVDYPLGDDAPFSVVKVLVPTLEGYYTPYVELGDRFKSYVEKNRHLRRTNAR
jgi:ribosomal protein S12 methylthiotransferase accessory factor